MVEYCERGDDVEGARFACQCLISEKVGLAILDAGGLLRSGRLKARLVEVDGLNVQPASGELPCGESFTASNVKC